MKFFYKKHLFALLVLSCILTGNALAQKKPVCVKAATVSQPKHILVSPEKLTEFYRNFKEEVIFKESKIVKSELAYYLIATEQNGQRVFAFELETKRKKLYLNSKLPVQACTEGELTLDTFLQDDGKITGCRIGGHSIRQNQ